MNRFLVVSGVVVAAFVCSAGCDKSNGLEKLRADGYGCTKAGAGATFIPKAGEHCFVCPDDTSLSKCTSNPVTSGCKEDPNGCGRASK